MLGRAYAPIQLSGGGIRQGSLHQNKNHLALEEREKKFNRGPHRDAPALPLAPNCAIQLGILNPQHPASCLKPESSVPSETLAALSRRHSAKMAVG